MALDISGLSYFMPLYAFLIVFLVVFALLKKTKILGGITTIDVIVAVIIGIIFATFANVQAYVQQITPWFAVLLIVLFFILALIGFGVKNIGDVFKPGFLWVFVIAMIVVLVVVAIRVFPNSFGSGASNFFSFFKEHGRIAGGIILLVIAAIVGIIITRK